MKVVIIILGAVALCAVVFVFWGYVIEVLSDRSEEERRAEQERQGRER